MALSQEALEEAEEGSVISSSEELHCDVLIVGAGGAGLTAAVTAAQAGLSVIVVEKSEYFGGSTALSGGWVWIPCNSAAIAGGIADSLAQADRYVRHQAGRLYNPERVQQYLQNGPEMIEFLERNSSVRFVADYTFADYFPDDPGGLHGGRSLVAAPFNGSLLGKYLPNLRPPLGQLTFLGMSIGSGANFKHFLNATHSFKSAAFVAKALAVYFCDLLRYGRGVRLYNGNALVARLARSAFDKGVDIRLKTTVIELIRSDRGRVTSAKVETPDGQTQWVSARQGVILASGGFSHDPEKRSQYLPAEQTVSIAPKESSGDGVRLAMSVGAAFNDKGVAPAYSAVFSKLRGGASDGALYPHFTDRAKPGIIAIDSNGRRFCNESNSYHDVAQEMIRQGIDGKTKRAYFIADHRATRKYGLGAARPAPIPLGPYLRSQYITKAANLRELASKLNLPEQVLVEEVMRFNESAAVGTDPIFKRGASSYNKFQGDYSHKPNPCLAPITQPPFYGVEVFAGDLGTFLGLQVGPVGEVMDVSGAPIPGLYAIGNDASNVFSGACLGGGVTIGPAMVFGYIAGKAIGDS